MMAGRRLPAGFLPLLARWELVLIVLILVAGAWSSVLSPYFLDPANLFDLTKPYIVIGLMALGLTFVVISGDIDISIASTLALTMVIFAQLWHAGVNIGVASLIGLAVGILLGTANGFLVSVLNLPSLAVTLGTLAAYRGLAFVILGGGGVTGFPETFTRLGFGYVGTSLIPISLVILLLFGGALALVLHGTRFGRYVFAIGANREAARFSGIPVIRVRIMLFALSGFMAAASGLLYAGFFGTARADAAGGALLDVVTAVVLGGVDIFGGLGTVGGVLLALLLVATLRNGMGVANIPGSIQNIVIGVLLLAAILAGNLSRAVRGRTVGTGGANQRRRPAGHQKEGERG
jgi:rhamnose transport system permease protein